MAKITTNTVKLSSKKGTSSSSSTVACNMCKGTGRLPKGYNKKK